MDGAASFLAVFFSSVAAFVSTELGKFVLLLVLFAKYPSKRGRFFAGAGKYAALILVTACSAFFAVYLQKIPAHFVGFLGLIPVGLGIREIFRKKADEKSIAGTTEESGKSHFGGDLHNAGFSCGFGNRFCSLYSVFHHNRRMGISNVRNRVCRFAVGYVDFS